ncbi:HAD family acid phosphatase [Actinoplanes sp. NPDC026623]|uniref:HAD family acid phosphatase n=1 Tax=Actinoplanes sp. NPDC026623 TaxID=3155610 RepID=UPI0033C50938
MNRFLRCAASVATATAVAVGAPATAYATTTAAQDGSGRAAASLALPPYQTWLDDVAAVAGPAESYLDERLPDSSVRAAIVLDIDNTSLQTGYRPGLTSPATPAVLEVARQAAEAGAAVFFVTARPQVLGWQSEANLRSAGYPFTGIYLRPWFDTQPDQALKTAARTAIERRGYTIVANIGNSVSDLASGHAERAFKLPDYDGQLA